MECKLLRKHLEVLEGNRSALQYTWDLIHTYVTPFRGNFYQDNTNENSVDWRRNRQVFDATAINANNTLAASLHGAITNPSHQWFGLRFRTNILQDDKEASQWLMDCSKQTFEAIRDSNFNLEANEAYIDLTSMGTAFISKEIIETPSGDFEDFVFKAIPIKEAFFDEDSRGRISRFFRKMLWTPSQICDKFGESTPERIRKLHEEGTSKDRIKVVYAVYNRENGMGPYKGGVGPMNRPIGAKYFLYETGEQLGDELGYYTMPVYAIRWRSTTDSMWGNSPAMHALPDILTLNELVELILNSLEKVVDPAIKVTEKALMTDLDLGPAGINVLRNIEDMQAFESRARFDVAELNRDHLQRSIRNIFYVDQLQLKESPAMTATEVQVRYELMQRLLGPTLGRLESDFLDPLVSSTFADLYRYRKFPETPRSILASGDPSIIIEYTSPMARAQRLDDAQNLQRFLSSVAQIGEINPEAMMKVDWDRAIELLSQYHGAEPQVLKSDAQVMKERKAMAEQAERMQSAEAMQKESSAIRNLEAVR